MKKHYKMFVVVCVKKKPYHEPKFDNDCGYIQQAAVPRKLIISCYQSAAEKKNYNDSI